MTRAFRSYVTTAVALGTVALLGCAADVDRAAPKRGEDWGDPNKYPELGGAYQGLTALGKAPSLDTSTATLTVTLKDEVAVIGRRAVDSSILINNTSYATAKSVKKLVVQGTGVNTLILDFLGGMFTTGSKGDVGIEIDLGSSGGNTLAIRATPGSDVFAVGTDGIGFNADSYLDIKVAWANVKTTSFSLGGGNDTFIATGGSRGVAGDATIGLDVYGGDGVDTITGGKGVDHLFGGEGADTLVGGLGNDVLSGEGGADVIAQGDASDGSDDIHCGTDSGGKVLADTVTYEDRGTLDTADDLEAVAIRVVDSNKCVGGATCTLDDWGLPQYRVGAAAASPAQTSGQISPAGEADVISPDCEVVVGSMDDDTLVGNELANSLEGGPGDDTLIGNAGDDSLSGGNGDDVFDESTTLVATPKGAGGDSFSGGNGTDTVTYALRTAAVFVYMDGRVADDGEASEKDNVGADIENLIATDHDDIVVGNNGDNKITGLLGNDSLAGGPGDDTFDEGTVTSGADTFAGGADEDTVDYSARTAALWITMDGVASNDGQGTAPSGMTPGASAEGDNVAADVENCKGGTLADHISGNALANNINGGAGLDTIYGLDGDDFLDGDGSAILGAALIDGGNGVDVCLSVPDLPAQRVSCELGRSSSI